MTTARAAQLSKAVTVATICVHFLRDFRQLQLRTRAVTVPSHGPARTSMLLSIRRNFRCMRDSSRSKPVRDTRNTSANISSAFLSDIDGLQLTLGP